MKKIIIAIILLFSTVVYASEQSDVVNKSEPIQYRATIDGTNFMLTDEIITETIKNSKTKSIKTNIQNNYINAAEITYNGSNLSNLKKRKVTKF